MSDHPHWKQGCYCRAGQGLPPLEPAPRPPEVPNPDLTSDEKLELVVLQPCIDALRAVLQKPADVKRLDDVEVRLRHLARAFAHKTLTDADERAARLMIDQLVTGQWQAANDTFLILVKNAWSTGQEWLLASKTLLLMLKKHQK